MLEGCCGRQYGKLVTRSIILSRPNDCIIDLVTSVSTWAVNVIIAHQALQYLAWGYMLSSTQRVYLIWNLGYK